MISKEELGQNSGDDTKDKVGNSKSNDNLRKSKLNEVSGFGVVDQVSVTVLLDLTR